MFAPAEKEAFAAWAAAKRETEGGKRIVSIAAHWGAAWTTMTGELQSIPSFALEATIGQMKGQPFLATEEELTEAAEGMFFYVAGAFPEVWEERRLAALETADTDPPPVVVEEGS